MDTAVPARTLGNLRPTMVVLLAIALTLAALGAVYVASRPTTIPAWGLAENGRILIATAGSLVSHAADGTDPRVLLSLPDGATDLTVSPDGQRVAFYVHSGPARVEVARIDGSGVTTLASLSGTVDFGDPPSWSPDGERIAYLTYDGQREHLAIAASDGSAVTELPVERGPTEALWHPAWSPDGETIAVVIGDASTDVGRIRLIDTDGSGYGEIPDVTVAASGGIRWSPDPSVQRLLYTRGTTLSTYIVDVATGIETRVVEGFWPTWSPDGSRISLWGTQTQVKSTQDALAGTGSWIPIGPRWTEGSCQDHEDLAGQSFCGPAGWSPDGTRLFAPDITGTFLLSVMADGSGAPIRIPLEDDVTDVPGPAAWQPIR